MSACQPCVECFCATLPRCPATITIDSDFTPDEALTLEIEDEFGNKYRIEDTAVYAGSALFSTEDLPEGLLYSGSFIFRILTVVSGYCDEPRNICGDYECIAVTIENSGSEPIICCPDAEESESCTQRLFLLLNDHTMNMDLASPINFMNVLIQGVGVINLPNISDVEEQDVIIRLIYLTTDNMTVNPGASDAINALPVGDGLPVVGVLGGVLILTINSAHQWVSEATLITTV